MLTREGRNMIYKDFEAVQWLCENVKRLFAIPSDGFKPWHNETVLSIHKCKLMRDADESAEEWLCRQSIKNDGM